MNGLLRVGNLRIGQARSVIAVAVFFMLTGRDPYHGVNAGIIALGVNFGVTGVVSLLTTVRVSGFDEIVPALVASPAEDAAGTA